MPAPCDSPVFHFGFDRVESLTIKASARSPNTDGIHIKNTNNVHIYSSFLSNAGCYYVDIKNMTCGSSHGIRHAKHSACSDSTPCINLILAQVELQPATRGHIVAIPFRWNAHGSVLTQTIPAVYCLMEETNATKE
ncbi:hypothetical protein GQ457_08G004750 [Hibiscus cannabinus]